MILDICVFVSFMLADKLFSEALWRSATFLSVNYNLCGKSVSSLKQPIIIDNNL